MNEMCFTSFGGTVCMQRVRSASKGGRLFKTGGRPQNVRLRRPVQRESWPSQNSEELKRWHTGSASAGA